MPRTLPCLTTREKENRFLPDCKKGVLSIKTGRKLEKSVPSFEPGKNSELDHIRCFMLSQGSKGCSSLIPNRIIMAMKQKIRNTHRAYSTSEIATPIPSNADLSCIGKMRSYLEQEHIDESATIAELRNHMLAKQPISIGLMSHCLAINLYQMLGRFKEAENAASRLLADILKYRLDQYVSVYLISLYRIYCKEMMWEKATCIVMKLLAFSWLHRMEDCEVWCYFELSRTYFFMGFHEEAQFYQRKAELGCLEPLNNQYRLRHAHDITEEIEAIRYNQKAFKLNFSIHLNHLTKPSAPSPLESLFSKKSTKMKPCLRTLRDDCRIRYVKNIMQKLASSIESDIRLSKRENIRHSLEKRYEAPEESPDQFFQCLKKGPSRINSNEAHWRMACNLLAIIDAIERESHELETNLVNIKALMPSNPIPFTKRKRIQIKTEQSQKYNGYNFRKNLQQTNY